MGVNSSRGGFETRPYILSDKKGDATVVRLGGENLWQP